MKLVKLNVMLVAVVLMASCNNKKEEVLETPSLKSVFKDDFYIGAAINADQIEAKNTQEDSIIVSEFNSITAENVMKSMFVQPEKGKYEFGLTDKFVAYGEKHNMFIHGHTLIWHSQLAPWMEKITDSTEMKAFMQDHINTVVTKYKGRIDSWDVVNEALNDDGTLRESVFLKALGENYLTDAFKLAEKADPNVDLYYNDYNLCLPAKRDGAIRLVKKIKENGGKVDGIGMQGHWKLTTPTLEEIEKSILAYSALGVKVAITELDITVLKNPWEVQGADVNQSFEGSAEMNPYPESLPDSIQNQLAKRYESIFKLFLKHKDKISRVTFWGFNDGQSWLNDWPIKGRTNYPLLFDDKLQPKKAYFGLIEIKEAK